MTRAARLLLTLLPVLMPAIGCRHRILTPSIGGRPAQTIQADARKIDGTWVVTLPLPLGNWSPKAVGEEQAMEVVTLEGRASVRWKVRPERWANSDRPFAFVLVGDEERKIEMSVTYTLFSRGTQSILNILAHGWIPLWPVPWGA